MLSADFLSLGRDVEMVNANADILHLDVMDGVFVPNISFGFPVVEAIAKIARKPLDVHLMIVDPEKYIRRFADAGADMISFHLEAVEGKGEPSSEAVLRTDRLLSEIRECGCRAGLVINPDISVERLSPHLEHCDYLLIMSVFAGFGGQSFIGETYGRIRTLRAELDSRGLNIPIEVDGGVSKQNIDALAEAGAEIFVAGSAIFRSECPADYIAELRQRASEPADAVRKDGRQ